MKFFVSSRMSELSVERKVAIETIHFSGHTPLYIETEPFVRDEPAREAMLSLLRAADGFLSMHYLSEGRANLKILQDHAPIEFELIEFCRLHDHVPSKAPVLLFRRTPDRSVKPSQRMLDWFDDKATDLGVSIVPFESPKDLQLALATALAPYEGHIDVVNPQNRLTIRYLGPDFTGLIGKISEVLFAKHKLNIDYISHAAAGGHSTVCIACSPRQLPGTSDTLDKSEIHDDLLVEVEQELLSAEADGRLLGGADSVGKPEIFVDVDPVGRPVQQYYVVIRAIDAPGQINAVCKELRTLKYNIDELQLRPTPPEYPRQTTMTLWLSRRDGSQPTVRQELDAIEGALQYLVGVRAFSIKAMPSPRSTLGDSLLADTAVAAQPPGS